MSLMHIIKRLHAKCKFNISIDCYKFVKGVPFGSTRLMTFKNYVYLVFDEMCVSQFDLFS